MQNISDLLKKTKKSTGDADESGNEKGTTERFEEKMVDIRVKELERETEAVAAAAGFPYINLKGFPIGPDTIATIPKPQAEKLKAVCFLIHGQEIRVGAVNPARPEAQEMAFELGERLHGHAVVYMISEQSFKYAFKMYEAVPEILPAVKGVEISAADLTKFEAAAGNLKDLTAALTKLSTTDIITFLIASGLKARASDIHIEGEEKEIKVRLRLDGVLNDVAEINKAEWVKIISRLKLIAGLKINISDQPQDGRFTIFLTDDKVDVRVSTIPTAFGESVVMRLLRSSSTGLKFEDLGIRGRAHDQLKAQIERPNGMIVTTGPTGSGKTTTLYAVLTTLNSPETKIITLEDPVEYKLPGINQSQIDYSKDYTFAKGLRSILRQDPDVVMVGEIRDLDTAEVAIQAALTGHLVISTIHTNSAAGAIPRFLSMGVKPFLLAPALNAVIGQRLVRKICANCKEEEQLPVEMLERAKKILGEIPSAADVKIDLKNLKFFHGKGCDACGGLGFKGRIGIYEAMIMNQEIEKIILSGQTSEYQMQEIAVKNGMITMAQDGLLKAADGITTAEEVFRVAE
ncbi:MAG: GspE/PulE family protein [Patescibacteria group bacterium]